MANVKINDLALAGGVSDTMQLETDIGGATENKITIAQLSDKIIDTDLGLTTTVANAVQTTNATTDGLAESTTVLTAPAANQFQLTNGTSDLLVTADCTIDQDLSTTADVTFNSVNMVNAINEFSTDGTMAGDSDSAVPTEKAVKIYGETLSSVDKPKYETLSIGSASLTATSSYLYLYTSSVKTVFLPNATTLVNGQAFIISNNGTYNTPILLSDSSTLFTLNAGETIRIVCIDNGTTNGSWNIIDKITALGGVTEDNIYSVRSNGSDSNSGLNIGNAFLTIQKGIDTADLQTPSSTDQYVVRVQDGGSYDSFTLASSPYIRVEAQGCQLQSTGGTYIIGDDNSVVFDKASFVLGSGVLIQKNGSSRGYLDAKELSGSSATTAIYVSSNSTLHANVDYINVTSSNIAVRVYDDASLHLTSQQTFGKIVVGIDGYCYIRTDEQDGDITVDDGGFLDIVINGRFVGNITAGVGSVVNFVAGSRNAHTDTIDSAAEVNILLMNSGESNIGSELTLPVVSLIPQSAATATDDGTIYYNSSSNDFQFRENGSWVTIGTTNVWQRVGTIISPLTAGDDLDMGTGDIDAANVDVTGNYKIGTDRVLAIDPTDRAQLFVGYHAGINTQINNNAYRNTAIGHGALETNVTGDYNTAVGYSSLNLSVAENASNTAVGANSLLNATGVHNTGIGSSVGYHQSGGNYNILIGGYAGNGGSGPTLYAKSNNVMIGYASGQDTLTGSGNIFLGYNSGFSETGSNKLYIENSNSASPLIYGEFDTNLVKINGTFQSTGNVTIGDGSAGVDYTLTFDGEDNDGVITWLEDEDAFNMTGKVRITGLTPQLILNDTDDDVFVIATVDDDLHFYNNIADHNSNFKFFTKTGDGSDYISLQMYGVGTSASTSPSERLVISYSAGLFSIYSTAGGGGTDRNLRLSAGGASDQLLLDTSGDISMSGTLTVPTVTADNIGAGTSDIIYPLQANAESTTLAVPLLIENQEGGVTSATGIRFKAVDDTTDIRAKAAIFFERTDAGGVGSLHLAVEGTNDDSNVDLTDARLTIDSSGDVTLTGDLTTTGEIVGGDLTITSSTPMLTFNDTDDDVYVLTTEGDDNFHIYNNIAGENLFLKLFTKDGDGTDTTSLQIFGVGTTASHNNNEALKIEYNTGYTLFQIISSASGTGTRRPLRLSADSTGGSDQLLLDTSGNVSMSGSLTVTGGVILPVDTSDVANPPTDAQLDTAFGTPASVGAGWTAYIDDNGAGTAFYQVVSDGTNWWHTLMTKAV